MSRFVRFAYSTLVVLIGVSLFATPILAAEREPLIRSFEQPTTELPAEPITTQPAEDEIPAPLRVVIHFLQLDEFQAQTLVRLMTEQRLRLAPIAAEIAQRQRYLDHLLGTEEPNPVEIGVLILQIRELKQHAEAIQHTVRNHFASVLNFDQQDRLKTIVLADSLQPVLPAFEAVGLI